MKSLFLLLITGFFTTLFGCGQTKDKDKKSNTPEKATLSIPVENITATKEQAARRAQSEAYCQSKNIPVYKNPNALFTATDDKVTLRTQDEVVDRALALCLIGLKSEGLEKKQLALMEKEFGITAKLSPVEKDYINAVQPTEQQTIDANWRYESLHVLLWALGYIDSLKYPDQMCNVADDVKIIYQLKEKGFREKATLRTKKEILDQADLILRIHWACTEARINNNTPPAGLNNSVVVERHYALNWLINYMNQDWDDVSTDT